MANVTTPSGNSSNAQETNQSRGRLGGRIALISGGGGGIGQETARLFVSEGASVLLCDLPESDAKSVAEGLGEAAAFCSLDTREPHQWRTAVEACSTAFGAEPDILVLTAGIMVVGSIEDTDPSDFHRAMDVNFFGTLNGLKAVAPGMRSRKKGSIVAISSMAGSTYSVSGMAPYAASKAALASLIRTAALDLGGTGVRANTIVPGQIDTPMSRAAGVVDDSFFAQFPVPRVGQPIDIAQATVYLASDESSFVTGTELLIDGGMEAGPVIG